jgi:hypothetical protein
MKARIHSQGRAAPHGDLIIHLGYDRGFRLPFYVLTGIPEAWIVVHLNGKVVEVHAELALE